MLVHGLVSGRYLLPTAERLAASVTVAVPDLPGFGPSEPAPRPLGIGGLADVLAAWMRARGLGGATVLGHSVGTQVVARLAAHHPGLVGRAVLVGPMGDPTTRGVAGYAARWARSLWREPASLHPVLLREAYELGPRFGLRNLRHAVADPTADTLAHVLVPTLVVRGEHDRIAPQRWCQAMAGLLPAPELAVVPGASHTVNWSAPDRLAVLTTGFSSRPA